MEVPGKRWMYAVIQHVNASIYQHSTVCTPLRVSKHLSIFQNIYVYVCVSICLSIYTSVNLSINQYATMYAYVVTFSSWRIVSPTSRPMPLWAKDASWSSGRAGSLCGTSRWKALLSSSPVSVCMCVCVWVCEWVCVCEGWGGRRVWEKNQKGRGGRLPDYYRLLKNAKKWTCRFTHTQV